MLDKYKIPHNETYLYKVDGKSFRTAIREGRKSRKDSGWMVDAHKTSECNKMRCYMSKDGSMGVAIKRNGDIVSVFSKAGAGRNAMGKLIPFAIMKGGKKADCYGGGLQNMYARFGGKATGKVKFMEEYSPLMYQANKKRGEAMKTVPSVVAMTFPSFEKKLKTYNPDKVINLARVKNYDDYDNMIKDRDAKLVYRDRGLGNVAG